MSAPTLSSVGLDITRRFGEVDALDRQVGDTKHMERPRALFAAESDRFELFRGPARGTPTQTNLHPLHVDINFPVSNGMMAVLVSYVVPYGRLCSITSWAQLTASSPTRFHKLSEISALQTATTLYNRYLQLEKNVDTIDEKPAVKADGANHDCGLCEPHRRRRS